MSKIDLDSLISQVMRNCSISDSRHSGNYSVCGLALRLRDLYKWETGLEPWVEKDTSEILDWIGEREERWDEVAEEDFRGIAIEGKIYDPFDTVSINGILEGNGLFYGAGYAYGARPTFFIGPVEEQKEINSCKVYVIGSELARDLFSTPALCQENCIVIRRQSAKSFLWEKIHYVSASGRGAVKFALREYGFGSESWSLQTRLDQIAIDEAETYVYHEIGEICDQIFDREIWRRIIADFPKTRVEYLARIVKDLLADTNPHGRLRHIVECRKTASLGFYVAFLETLAKKIFPEIAQAFETFMRTEDWSLIAKATSLGYDISSKYAESMMEIYQSNLEGNENDRVEREISKCLLQPLGV